MKFKIKPDAKIKITESLAEGLDNAVVDNNIFPNWLSFFMAGYLAQKNLPENGLNRDLMEKYVGDMPLVEFIVEKVRLELIANRDYSSEGPRCKLIGSPGYSDAKDLATRMISEFESLPWTYQVSIELSQKQFPPELFDSGVIGIGSRATLRVPDLLFAESFPLDHENERISRRMRSVRGLGMLLLGNKKEEWKAEGVCFSQTVHGFIGAFGGQEPVKMAQNSLEAFIGLGLAKKCLTFTSKLNDPTPKFRWIIHQTDEFGKNIPVTALEVDDELSNTLKSVETFAFAENYPEVSRIPWLRKNFSEIGKLFDAEKNQSLLLASKWFFDSFKGTDETLRYVRRMTCLEILLGSSVNTDSSSLSEIMSNRLAYMIGKRYTERESLIREFKEVYGLRSRILHQGKHRFGFRESHLTSKLKEFCEKAIEAECGLLIASSENKTPQLN